MVTSFPYVSHTSRNTATTQPYPRTALKAAPTEYPASDLSSWLRVMPIGVDVSAPGEYSLNRDKAAPA
jgi:hypothetical protein